MSIRAREQLDRFLFALVVGLLGAMLTSPVWAQTPTVAWVPPDHGFTLHEAADAIGVLISLASLAANWVAPDSRLGKTLHWLALNGPKIQRGVSQADEPPSGP